MDRRDALRAATAAAIATVAGGCDRSTGDSSPAQPSGRTLSPSTLPVGRSPAAVASGTAPALPGEVSHGPRNRDTVALTFHGQGEPALVGRLLDEIGRGGARVTVLAVGTWLAEQPLLAHRILDDGHELGNHTQHHADITRMTAARAHAEINECAAQLRALTGSIGRWFRPSQTQHATAMIRAQAAKVGYPTCLSYDVDSRDYTDPGAQAVIDTTLGAVRGGSIVSLHFGHLGTVTAMAGLLDGLHRRGLTPVTMTELMT